MSKKHKKSKYYLLSFLRSLFLLVVTSGIMLSFITIALVSALWYIDSTYAHRVYPYVYVDGVELTGKTKQDIISYWDEKNTAFKNAQFELQMDEHTATISGSNLQLGYDGKLIAEQAFSLGRTGGVVPDMYTKLIRPKTVLTAVLSWNSQPIDEALDTLAHQVEVAPQEGLFEYKDGKVTAFQPSKPGKRINRSVVKESFERSLSGIPSYPGKPIVLKVPVEKVEPNVSTDKTNELGITTRIGYGYSEFQGSIPGRIHNVELSASRFHGVLIPPGGVISYNEVVGDISSSTGFKQAYVIKDGRTVLGDGGGACQTSTTLFRAALSAGLPILQRQAHAYRVHYYEEGGYKPGLDATVFAPSVDLKIKNDTPGHILIQSHIDTKNMKLTIELFGTSDGRKAEIVDHKILSQSPPPPPLYQDDPTLKTGVVKQVDWAAWGAKTIFTYKVTRNGETLINQDFVSNFRPWQAIYLRGTGV